MDISAKQLAGKPKKIGTRGGKNIMELTTKGGLTMIVGPKDGGFETLGAGPHKAVARFIAKKKAPDIQWSELAKADYVEPEYFEHLLPQYQALTQALRKQNGDE